MHKFLLFCLLWASTNSFASEACDAAERFATATMNVRQIGLSLNSALSTLDKSVPDISVRNVLRPIVLEAWDVPVVPSESGKQKAIEAFARRIYNRCN